MGKQKQVPQRGNATVEPENPWATRLDPSRLGSQSTPTPSHPQQPRARSFPPLARAADQPVPLVTIAATNSFTGI